MITTMSVPQRYGITFPFDGIPLLDQRELVRELVDLGYTDLWSAESGGYDAFIPLAVAAQWAPSCGSVPRSCPRTRAARTRSRRRSRRCAKPRPDASRSVSVRRRTSSSNVGTA